MKRMKQIWHGYFDLRILPRLLHGSVIMVRYTFHLTPFVSLICMDCPTLMKWQCNYTITVQIVFITQKNKRNETYIWRFVYVSKQTNKPLTILTYQTISKERHQARSTMCTPEQPTEVVWLTGTGSNVCIDQPIEDLLPRKTFVPEVRLISPTELPGPNHHTSPTSLPGPHKDRARWCIIWRRRSGITGTSWAKAL